MLPKAGGAYNYIKRAFGDYAGFISGWFDVLCNMIVPAFFCIVLSQYCSLLFPVLKNYQTITAISFLTLFTLINLPGVKSGSITQQITSAIKIVLFLVLTGACFFTDNKNIVLETSNENNIFHGSIIIAIFKALQLIMGTYDGWMSVSFFAEEDEQPGKNIPKSYFIGAISIMILYLLINAAILYVLPVSSVANSALAASDAAGAVLGNWGAVFITVFSIFSLLSILNAYMMIPSRILYGLSRDGFFIKQATVVNKGGTPVFALLFCFLVDLILIIFSSFDQLFAFGVFMLTIVTGLAFTSVIKLRKKEPHLHRPYRAWGYPYTTYLTIAVTVALFIGFAVSDNSSFMIVLIMMAVSYPCFRLLNKRKNNYMQKTDFESEKLFSKKKQRSAVKE